APLPSVSALRQLSVGHGYRHVRVFGSNRSKSEDAAEAFERDDTLVIVLADGAGGIRGGATASAALVAVVRSAVADMSFTLHDAQQWADLFTVADQALAKNQVGETAGVVVALGPRGLIGVSTGDSEAWVVTATEIDDLTAGQHTKRRLGSGRVTPAVFGRPPLVGTLLVGSDGLVKQAAMNVIAGVVRASPIGVAAERLIELARLPSGKFADDVAVVLVSGNPVPQQSLASS
ncbi:MAG: hypothetical protein ACRENE_27080, partial [Polyangiaceae bacterium]